MKKAALRLGSLCLFAACAGPALLALAPASARAAEVLYDLALAADSNARILSVGAARRHFFFPARRLSLGYGARASMLTGRVELSPVRADGAEDRLLLDNVRLATLNASVHAAVRLSEPLEAGFNLDVAGGSLGGSTGGSYRPAGGGPPVGVSASPAKGNLFLFGSNDEGSLNSEFYAALRISPALSLRAGLSHFLTEYRADRELPGGRRSFRRFSNLLFVGLRWIPGNS